MHVLSAAQLFPHMPQFCASVSRGVQAGAPWTSQHMLSDVPSHLGEVVLPQ